MILSESMWKRDDSRPLLLKGTIGQMLAKAAADNPYAVAFVHAATNANLRTQKTYAELLAEAEATARYLLTQFQPGERIAIWAPSMPEWLSVWFGSALAGMVTVTINPAYQAKELAYVLGQSRSAGLAMVGGYQGHDLRSKLREVSAELPDLRCEFDISNLGELIQPHRQSTSELPHVLPHDPALITYTSGTTGFSKGAVLPHHGLVNNARLVSERMQIDQKTKWLNVVPMFHIGGTAFGTLVPMFQQATQVMSTYSPKFALSTIESESITLINVVPTMILGILDHPDFDTRDVSTVEIVSSGGSTISPQVVNRLERSFGARYVSLYGLTETCGAATQTRLDDSVEDKAATVGTPMEGSDLKVIDPSSGEIVPCGVVGEICIRRDYSMLGYFDMPEKTAEALDADGWIHTNDVGSMDERGYLTVTGRLTDMIIRGGENVYPREIEDALAEQPGVLEAAVIGVPDDYLGERVVAFIRLAGGTPPEPEVLEAALRLRLARYKVPAEWYFLDEFPTNPIGKVQRLLLREMVL